IIIAAMPRSGKGDRSNDTIVQWPIRNGRLRGRVVLKNPSVRRIESSRSEPRGGCARGRSQTHRPRDLDPEEEEFAPGSSSLELAATASRFLEPPRRASPELTKFQVRPLLTMVMVPRWSVRRKGISFWRNREIVSECGWPYSFPAPRLATAASG